MRARLFFLLLAIVLVAGFAALNWPEFMRVTTLDFGLARMDAPLGAILLALLGLGVLAALISGAMLRSQMQITENRYSRDLQAQRELADKAEASRFTELREYLDYHFREGDQRERVTTSEFERSMLQNQRDLRAQVDQMSRSLELRLGQLEGRIEARMDRLAPAPELERRTGLRRAEDAAAEPGLGASTASDQTVRQP